MREIAEIAILGSLSGNADGCAVIEEIEEFLGNCRPDPSEDGLRKLIAWAAPVWTKHTGNKITLGADCRFPEFVSGIAKAQHWHASRRSIVDLTMRSRPPAAQSAFGKQTT